VLTNQIAGRRQDHDVPAGRQDRVNRDPQHHFGFSGAGRRLEQKLEDAVVESGRDRVDRFALVVGELERFARLDQLVGERDALAVLIDGRPDGGGDEFGCG